jgi:hypothetical protein
MERGKLKRLNGTIALSHKQRQSLRASKTDEGEDEDDEDEEEYEEEDGDVDDWVFGFERC